MSLPSEREMKPTALSPSNDRQIFYRVEKRQYSLVLAKSDHTSEFSYKENHPKSSQEARILYQEGFYWLIFMLFGSMIHFRNLHGNSNIQFLKADQCRGMLSFRNLLFHRESGCQYMIFQVGNRFRWSEIDC